jgi:histidinol-phosphate aminotransferase
MDRDPRTLLALRPMSMPASGNLLSVVEEDDLAGATVVRQAFEDRAATPRYHPVTSLDKIERSQIDPSTVLKLDWNEGAVPPAPAVAAALLEMIQGPRGHFLNWYPHLAGGRRLLSALAAYCSVGEGSLLITNGSDAGLALLCHAFLDPGRSVLAPMPTYEHFCVTALATGATLLRLSVPDPFVADESRMAAAIARHRPTLAYLVSPNNPTGTEWSVAAVHELATRFPDVIFVVDEAYHEFASLDPRTGGPMTCAGLAASMPNVIVTRTFSKAFCLAAVRCGYLVASPATITGLLGHYNPKSVNELAQVAAHAALGELETYYRPYIERSRAARAGFIRQLEAQGIPARCGGGGNFVCLKAPDRRTAELCARLEEHAIYVRDMDAGFPGHVRITIGLDMERAATALATVLRDMGAFAAVS